MIGRAVVVTEPAMGRLVELIETGYSPTSRDLQHLDSLERKLGQAKVLSAAEIPPDAVTMHSLVRVRDLDTGVVTSYTLVYPESANVATGRVSVLAPIGTALLGHREGDEIEWRMPGGTRRLKIVRVAYQPEAAARASKSIHGGRVPTRTDAGLARAARFRPDFRPAGRPRQHSKTAPTAAPKARGSWRSA